MTTKLFGKKSVTRKRQTNSDLLQYANENREEECFNDITVIAGKLSIKANRMVLACHSKYFENMFKTKTVEKHMQCVEIQDINSVAVKSIIDYFYTGSIKIDSENVISLLTASDYMQVDDVIGFCNEFLGSVVSPKNSIDVMKAARSHANGVFTKWVHQYISDYLGEVALTRDFKCLSKLDFIACVTRGDNRQADEESKYQALILWIKYDEDMRKTVFAELFRKVVDLDRVSIVFSKDVLLQEQLIRGNIECYELVLTAFSNLLESKSSPYLQPAQSKVISLGGFYTRKNVTDVYSLHGEALMNYPELPIELNSHSSLKFHDLVFCIGGKTDLFGEIANCVWQLNLKHCEWREMTSMGQKRCNMGATVYQDNLIVAGGEHENRALDSVEFYQVAEDQWNSISPMKRCREGNTLVSCEKDLLVLGGKDGPNVLSSVERLQDLNGIWQDIKPMQTPRYSFAAVNCNGIIYAIGGQSHLKQTLKTVEKFDQVAGTWSYSKELKSERFGHSACVLNGKIIVVGGQNANLKATNKIECYDPLTDTWSIVGAISDVLIEHTVVAA